MQDARCFIVSDKETGSESQISSSHELRVRGDQFGLRD